MPRSRTIDDIRGHIVGQIEALQNECAVHHLESDHDTACLEARAKQLISVVSFIDGSPYDACAEQERTFQQIASIAGQAIGGYLEVEYHMETLNSLREALGMEPTDKETMRRIVEQ